MNRAQHYSLLRAMEMDKKNLLKYQEIYNYAYILSDGDLQDRLRRRKGPYAPHFTRECDA